MKLTVCVIGLGYIGLPAAAFIASQAIRVIGVDTDAERVEQINKGEVPFHEPGFEAILASAVERGFLTAQTDMPTANSYIIAVPTPFTEDHAIDTSFIDAAATAMAPKLSGGELIVLESTAPPGTTQRLADFVIEQRPDLTLEEGQPNELHFAHAPERVLPGNIAIEMAQNDRVVGGLTPRASELAKELYATFSNGQIHTTDARTAEMVKLAENTYRDINIAYANELSIISDKLDIDVWELIELANHHPRVNILQPGPGVGGHCIAVDPWFIVSAAPEESQLIRTAREVNDSKPGTIVNRALDAISGIEKPTVSCLGITFKPNVSDLRHSPALQIVEELADAAPHAQFRVFEPHIDLLAPSLNRFKNVVLADNQEEAHAADLVIGLVPHSVFDPLRKRPPAGLKLDAAGFWRFDSQTR